LNQIVQRLELPLSAARAVVAVQTEITQQADAVKADRSLTPDQRQTQLATLRPGSDRANHRHVGLARLRCLPAIQWKMAASASAERRAGQTVNYLT
jgi:hypothetical protein